MGKASRWMINFLLGRKEEKDKKKNVYICEDSVSTPASSVPASPTYKRRWSFGKSSNNKEKFHRSSKSVDSYNSIIPIITHPSLPLQSEYHTSNKKALVSRKSTKTFLTPNNEADKIRKAVEDAAATRIQAAFRSFLARKALHALKGLVKIQAIVRGHLVRKQTTDIIRGMQALMSIQFRARFQRIQMAEESKLLVKSQSSRHRYFPKENGFDGASREASDETRRSRHSYSNHAQIERIEQGITKFYSRDHLSISQREHCYEEFSFLTAQNSPRTPDFYATSFKEIPGRASFTCQKADYVQPVYHQKYPVPNYMANTESSKAKTRSQSEPKQRPHWNMKSKGKRTTSVDGVNPQQDIQTQISLSHPECIAQENRDPWFIKLYRSAKSKDKEDDINSTYSSYSNHNKFQVTYEPHLNLY